ncbi:MAG: biotin--[acetyl-CoA-carboxylase] ligase [Spirochaetales bacterium]|nr:biotin--[acetyl-CoA-carboxylase] ligase [Spirochaetales bacterium]
MSQANLPGRIYRAEETDSTQNDARRLIEEGRAGHGDICTAHYQSAGRGRIPGRVWEGERDAALMMTLLLRKEKTPASPPLSLLLGLGAARAMEKLYPLEPRIKWPNDIYLGKRKCGGILCESRGDWWLCGMGINLNQTDFPEELKEKAVSLSQECGRALDREELLVEIREEIFSLFPRSPREILEGIEERLLWKDQKKTLLLGDPRNREILEGIVTGINGDGALLFMTDQGMREIYSAEFPG